MTKDKLIVTQLYPLISKGMSRPEAKKIFIRDVSGFIDRNHNALSSSGPSIKMTFGDDDREIIYRLTGVTREEVKAILKSTPSIKEKWAVMNEPYAATTVLATRYAAIAKDRELELMTVTYMMLSLYPYIQKKYFKFEPDERIMDYVISSMSNKYKIKTSGTILKALIDTAEKCYEIHRAKIIEGTDRALVKYVMDIRTRINSLVKNIARSYYIAHGEGNYLNADSDSFEEGNYRETDNDMYAIERITNNVTLTLMVHGPDLKNVSMAANLCKVSVNELRNYVSTLIVGEKREEVRRIIEAIITTYITEGGKADEISRDNNFLIHANNVYKKSNTSDENVIKIKNILDNWMEDIDIYKKTQRIATINDFRRALYMFIVITIMKQ